jgi:hypothetical protein
MCERTKYQSCKCSIVFGEAYQELWCQSCSDEFNQWVDEQAQLAHANDRAEGLGWLWEQITPAQPN